MNLQRIRVPVGLLFSLVYLYLAQPSRGWFIAGISLAWLGVALRVWAAGYLRKWHRLAVDGPYRWTRNPLYLGSFLIGTGFTLAGTRPFLMIVFLVLFIIIYKPVMTREEEELEQAYGATFAEYRRRVPLFWPLGCRWRPTSEKVCFSWEQVVRNREYQAVLGGIVLTLLVGAKMLW